MNPFDPSLQSIATLCSLCHDQCASACPVAEISHRQVAFPSRLATLALELNRGNLEPDGELMKAMLHCIHCNACTESCVYIDNPVDVTPLVRWARQTLIEHGQEIEAMRQMRDRILKWGNPYADVREILNGLKGEFPEACKPGGTLVIADAAELAYAPQAALDSLHLLHQAGYSNLAVSGYSYTGWELWQYASRDEFIALAKEVRDEIERCQPEMVVTLSPASSYLLSHIYAKEFGWAIPVKVSTVAEAVSARIDQFPVRRSLQSASALLIYSYAEAFQLHSLAAGEILTRFGLTILGIQKYQPYHRLSFPEGWILGLSPAPDHEIARQIVQLAEIEHPDTIICTSAFSEKMIRESCPEIPVVNWASYLIDIFGR